MSDDKLLAVLTDIRNWIRAASFQSVKTLLEKALPDSKSRDAYQMLDGYASIEQVRIACKMSPNALVALAQKCEAMGLMETNEDRKRVRLFDLTDFDMIGGGSTKSAKAKE
jgi:hypothetical protein